MQSRHQHCIRSSRDISLQGEICRDNNSTEDKVVTTPGCHDINCEDLRSRQHQVVATAIVQNGSRDNTRLSRHQLQGPEGRDVSFNEKRSRQDQAVATPASLKICRNHTEAPATRTEVATRARCRDSISLLGQLTKVQKEIHRNYGPTLEPYKYAAAKEDTQLGGNLKERSGLLKAPVFLFFFHFSFDFILD